VPAHEASITALDFSFDGRRILTVTEEGTARIFESGARVATQTLLVSEEALFDAAFDPAATRLATCGLDRHLRVYSVDGVLLHTFSGHHSATVSCLSWSKDGNYLVTGDASGALAVWDVRSGKILTVMRGHAGAVLDVLFSGDGASVFSASEDRTVRMWNSETGHQERVFSGHEDQVRALVRLGDSGEIATAAADRSLRVWNPNWNPGMTKLQTATEDGFRSASFSLDNRKVYASTNNGGIVAFDGDTRQALPGYSLSPSAPPVGDLEGAGGTEGLVQAVSKATGRYVVGSRDNQVLVYHGVSGQLVKVIRGFDTPVAKIAISDDGNRMVAGGGRGTLYSIDLSTYEKVPIKLHVGLVAVAISADGRWIATAEYDERLRLWDALTGEELGSHRDAHSSAVTSLAFSVEGDVLISASKDRSARLWSLPGIDFLEPELGRHPTTVNSAVISPVGSRVATGHEDGHVRIWDQLSRELLLTLQVSASPVLALDFSSDGKRLLVTTQNDGIFVLESESDEARYQLRTVK
jgi:WD40 repeat protein